jgi:hypothetical protein
MSPSRAACLNVVTGHLRVCFWELVYHVAVGQSSTTMLLPKSWDGSSTTRDGGERCEATVFAKAVSNRLALYVDIMCEIMCDEENNFGLIHSCNGNTKPDKKRSWWSEQSSYTNAMDHCPSVGSMQLKPRRPNWSRSFFFFFFFFADNWSRSKVQ